LQEIRGGKRKSKSNLDTFGSSFAGKNVTGLPPVFSREKGRRKEPKKIDRGLGSWPNWFEPPSAFPRPWVAPYKT